MAVFVSKYRRFSVADEKRRAAFRTNGGGSYYETADEEEIAWMESLGNFKKDFVRTDTIPQAESGIEIRRQAAMQEKVEDMKETLLSAVKELLELYPKAFTASGNQRRDAAEDVLKRIEELQIEIGLLPEVKQ